MLGDLAAGLEDHQVEVQVLACLVPDDAGAAAYKSAQINGHGSSYANVP
jgi:hypothetical protein